MNMKPFLGLRTTAYMVSDLNAAKKWYAKLFDTDPYFDQPFYVGFNIGGYELGLLPDEKNNNKGENILSYWGVNDIHTVYKRLIDHGATAHEKPTNVGGEILVASAKDPWDNIIGIIYNPDFKLPS